MPCRESTLTTPTVFVWRASVRCEIGSTMGPSGRKMSSLSPGRAGTSPRKRAYAVSKVASICFSSNDASSVPAPRISSGVTRPLVRTLRTGGGEKASLPLTLTVLRAARPSRLFLLTTSRSAVSGMVTDVSGEAPGNGSCSSGAFSAVASMPGSISAWTCAGACDPPSPGTMRSLLPG